MPDVVRIEERQKWFKSKEVPGWARYSLVPTTDGKNELRDANQFGESQQLALVNTESQSGSVWVFAGLAGGSGHRGDLSLTSHWRVAEPHKFWTIGSWANLKVPLSRESAEKQLLGQLSPHVSAKVPEVPDDQLGNIRFWTGQLTEWLQPLGVIVTVEQATWSSEEKKQAVAQAARAAEETKRAILMAKEAAIRQAEVTRQAERKEREAELEHQSHLTQTQREQELARLAQKQALGQTEFELSLWKLQMEKATLVNEHEGRNAAAKQQEFMAGHLAELQATIEKLKNREEEVGTLLRDMRKGQQEAAQELLNRHDFTLAQLQGWGFDLTKAKLVEWCREAAFANGGVKIRLVEARSRSIGHKKALVVIENSRLDFELSCEKSGYVTVLNVGTNGDYIVIVPNKYVAPGLACVTKGITKLPGTPLLPPDRLKRDGFELVECGPPGWEHIVAFVSDEPLISDTQCDALKPLVLGADAGPYFDLSKDDRDRLIDRARDLGPDRVAIGVVSFLVQ